MRTFLRCVAIGAAWTICALALSMVGCASPLTAARKSVSAAATLGTAAGTLFATVDDQRQDAIAAKLVADHDVSSAEKARDAWRAQRGHVLQALRTYDAVVSAAGAAAELAGNKQIDLPVLLGSLAQAYASLSGALASFGILLPKVGL